MEFKKKKSSYILIIFFFQTSNPAFRKPKSEVLRRFSDFLGLHAKLAEKHVPFGIIVPPAPEKSVIGKSRGHLLKFVDQQ